MDIEAVVRKEAPKSFNRYLLSKYGFNEQGFCWLNFSKRESTPALMKKFGAEYNRIIGWYFSKEVSLPDVYKVNIKEMFITDENGTYIEEKDKFGHLIGIKINEYLFKQFFEEFTSRTVVLDNESENGRFYDIPVTVEKVNIEETNFQCNPYFAYDGIMYIYTFRDDKDIKYVWKTTSTTEYDRLKEGVKLYMSARKAEHQSNGYRTIYVNYCKFSDKPKKKTKTDK